MTKRSNYNELITFAINNGITISEKKWHETSSAYEKRIQTTMQLVSQAKDLYEQLQKLHKDNLAQMRNFHMRYAPLGYDIVKDISHDPSLYNYSMNLPDYFFFEDARNAVSELSLLLVEEESFEAFLRNKFLSAEKETSLQFLYSIKNKLNATVMYI